MLQRLQRVLALRQDELQLDRGDRVSIGQEGLERARDLAGQRRAGQRVALVGDQHRGDLAGLADHLLQALQRHQHHGIALSATGEQPACSQVLVAQHRAHNRAVEGCLGRPPSGDTRRHCPGGPGRPVAHAHVALRATAGTPARGRASSAAGACVAHPLGDDRLVACHAQAARRVVEAQRDATIGRHSH